jgi:hypothetical protein
MAGMKWAGDVWIIPIACSTSGLCRLLPLTFWSLKVTDWALTSSLTEVFSSSPVRAMFFFNFKKVIYPCLILNFTGLSEFTNTRKAFSSEHCYNTGSKVLRGIFRDFSHRCVLKSWCSLLAACLEFSKILQTSAGWTEDSLEKEPSFYPSTFPLAVLSLSHTKPHHSVPQQKQSRREESNDFLWVFCIDACN